MQAWMITAPRSGTSKREIYEILEQTDAKKWIIAKETGRNGYEHWQIRIIASRPDFFDYVGDRCPKWHIEKAQTEEFAYERKEGKYWTSEDTTEIRICRFGELRRWQKQLTARLKKQSVREIDVVLDTYGNKGKSFYAIALYERGEALVVPRYSCTPEKLSAFVCSAYKGEPIIIIDIPRASKPTTALYETMEEIKDGLVFDPRYCGTTKNIRGVKLVVFTNHKLKLDNLSDDRWVLHGITADGALS